MATDLAFPQNRAQFRSDGSIVIPSGATLVVESGATITSESGSTFDAAGTFEVGGVAITATAAELNQNAGKASTAAEVDRVADVSARLIAAGGTKSITEVLHSDKIIALDTAAGSVVTLPPATGSGTVIKCFVSVTATSNSHIVKVGDATDAFAGFIDVLDMDGTTISSYKAAGDAAVDDTITMNRTTTGGLIGDWVECVDILLNLWMVKGKLTCVAGNNPATPFSATV